jgi:hypothetical protein
MSFGDENDPILIGAPHATSTGHSPEAQHHYDAAANTVKRIKAANLRPKLMIIGHARHGKDTAAEHLRYTFASSSEFVGRRVVFDRLEGFYRDWMSYGHASAVNDFTPDEVFDAMFADRVNHRALWKDLIAQYCADNPARTAQEMLAEGNDMYVGMRARREFEAAHPLFDHVIWIDRSEHLPPEPPDSMELVRRQPAPRTAHPGRVRHRRRACEW